MQKASRSSRLRRSRRHGAAREVHPAEPSSGAFHALAVLTITALGLLAYANSLQVPFIYDDHPNILNNPKVRWTHLGWSELVGTTGGWLNPSRVVAYASFGLNHYWGGYDVWGYHVVNVALHLLNAGLVYALALATLARVPALRSQRLRPSVAPWIAVTAALVFVAHPIQTQAVTYVVQRMTSLCAFFYLSALLLYVHGRTAATPWRRATLLAGVGLCWGLALGSKQIAAALPLALLLYEWFFFQDLSLPWIRRNVGFGLLALVCVAAVAWLYLGSAPLDRLLGGYERRDFTLGERLLTQPRVVMFYLSLLLLPLPSRLNLTHDVTTSHSLLDPVTTLLSLGGLLGLLGLAVWLAPRQRIVSFALLWFFLHLVIESSVIALEMVFEHRLYLPMFGVALGAAWLLYAAAGSRSVWPVGVAAVLCLLLALGAHQRNRAWQDPVTLWSDAVSKSPRHARAQMNLGGALAFQGRGQEGVAHLREAVRLDPDLAQAHFKLGVALAVVGRSQEALDHLREAAALRPDYLSPHLNLGVALTGLGRSEEAAPYLRRVLEIQPDHAEAHFTYGNALQDMGRFQQAATHYQAALRTEPNYARAHFRLAWLRATSPDPKARDGQQALVHARRALELAGPQNVAALESVAAAHAELGDFPEAVAWQERAVQIASGPWKTPAIGRLELYRSGEPYRTGVREPSTGTAPPE